MQVAQLLVTLSSAIAWPAVIIVLIVYFGRDLRRFVQTSTQIRVNVAGVEGTFTRQLESAAALAVATVTQRSQGPGDVTPVSEAELREIAGTVRGTAAPAAARRLSEASVLWVDDVPNNNLYERAAMEALGIRFTITTSTADALAIIRASRYDAIVSDMARPPDPQAGYTLLEQLRSENITIPFIIYAGSNLPEHRALARVRGAIGSTNNPKELFQLVIAAVVGAST